jgi:hypothetical protein
MTADSHGERVLAGGLQLLLGKLDGCNPEDAEAEKWPTT